MTEAVRKGKTIKSSNRCNVILLLYSIGSFYFLEQKIFSSKNPIGNLFEDFSQFVSTYVPFIHDGTFCVFTMIFAFSVYSTDYFILNSVMYRNFKVKTLEEKTGPSF